MGWESIAVAKDRGRWRGEVVIGVMNFRGL